MLIHPTEYFAFLSRLCGGEYGLVKLRIKRNFLSRLCGGELFI